MPNKETEKELRERRMYGATKKELYKLFGNKCSYCGEEKKLEVHHRDGNGSGKPVKEKNNNLDNIQLVCVQCHRILEGKRRRGELWSKKYDKCVVCGSDKNPHIAKGICSKCYDKSRRKYKSNYYKINRQKYLERANKANNLRRFFKGNEWFNKLDTQEKEKYKELNLNKSMQFKPEKLYRVSEIMKMDIFPFSARTFQRRIVDKELPAIRIKGSGITGVRYYVKGEDINNYLNKILNEEGE